MISNYGVWLNFAGIRSSQHFCPIRYQIQVVLQPKVSECLFDAGLDCVQGYFPAGIEGFSTNEMHQSRFLQNVALLFSIEISHKVK